MYTHRSTHVSFTNFIVYMQSHANFNPLMYSPSTHQTTCVLPYDQMMYQMYRVIIDQRLQALMPNEGWE